MSGSQYLFYMTYGDNSADETIDRDSVSGSAAGQPTEEYQFPSDTSFLPLAIAIDPASDVYFISDYDGINNNVTTSQIFEEHFGETPTFNTPVTTDDAAAGYDITALSLDASTDTLYYGDGTEFYADEFNSGFGAAPTQVGLASFTYGVGQTTFDQVDQTAYVAEVHGSIYVGFTSTIGTFDANYIYKVSGLTQGATSGAVSDAIANGGQVPLNDGIVEGLAIDTANDTLYFTTEPTPDLDANAGYAGATPYGGIYALALNGPDAGQITTVWSAPMPTLTGPLANMTSIVIDPATGEYYVDTYDGGSGGIYEGNVGSNAAPVLAISTATQGNGQDGQALPLGLAIDQGGNVLSAVVQSIDGNGAETTGLVTTADTVRIAVSFSETVLVTGTPTLSLNDGGTATYVSGAGSTTLVFSYTPQSGQDTGTLQVTGLNGSVTDNAGTAFNTGPGLPATLTGVQVDTTAPSLAVISTTQYIQQGGTDVGIASAVQIDDATGTGTLSGASVAITDPQPGDVLGIDGNTGGTLDGITYSEANGTLTLAGPASLAAYMEVLDEVTYQDEGDDPSTGSHPMRTIEWTIHEQSLSTSVITEETINRAPVVANGGQDQSVVEGGTYDGNALSGVTDPDGDTVIVAPVSVGVQTGLYGSLTVDAGGAYSYVASNTSAIDSAAGGSPPVDVFTITVTDGGGGSTTETLAFSIDRPPVLSGVTAAGTYVGGPTPVTVDAALTIDDPDGAMLTGATVSIGTGFLAGDMLDFSDQNDITGSYNEATGVLNFFGDASASAYQQVLESVGFSSSASDPTDGGTDFERTISFAVSDTAGVTSTAFEATVDLCYLRGTRILTPGGEMRIEDLAAGDRVVTRFGGIRPIRWIGRQSFGAGVVGLHGEHDPVCIRAGALGENMPLRDLFVSAGHSMLIDDTLVLARSLVNGITVVRATETVRRGTGAIEYFQLDLGSHDCVIAEGVWSETFADGPGCTAHGLRGCFHNVAEFFEIFPDVAPAEALVLCAPRPVRGPALETMLTPIAARAAAVAGNGIGPLDGRIDAVTGQWYVEGWALDTRYPDLPVQLEVFLEDRRIGTVLACDFRDDLRAAGKGRGRCAFRFRSPVRLRPEALEGLRVRRASDGAAIGGAPWLADGTRPAAAHAMSA